MKWRLFSIISLVLLVYSALFFKLYNLQIEKRDFYSARAESQYRLAGLLEARRGTIYLTDKSNTLVPAALNKDYKIVYASPKLIEDALEAAGIMSQILDIPSDVLVKKFSKAGDDYEMLAEKITEEQVQKIDEARIKGIYIDKKSFRFYPYENLAAHLLGFVGLSGGDDEIKGRYGLEAYYNEELKGVPGEIKDKNFIGPTQGKDIVLTIDRNIQAQAEKILKATVDKAKASGGSVIVQDPKTGKILALANNPEFNPNEYSKFPIANFLNSAVQAVYEPGSVFKVLTMSAGIESGEITPGTQFNDPGFLTLNGKTIKNYEGKAFGKVTMTQVIENSINTGAAFAAKKTGYDVFYDYIVKFGFDGKTNIGLPGEVKSNLKSLKSAFREINFATAAFGQGVAVTPIALISAVSAIANKGILMKPHLIASEKPEILRTVISSETAAQVTQMMIGAVKKGVIGEIPNYEVAGKTGTAQIPDFKKGGYTNEFIHTFTGFAPASNPRFVILVKVDKPQVGPLAGVTVVPAFRELGEFILNYYNIPPDNLPASANL